jgi:exopolysaccharide biosynthesis polyprenyl glycosylphosphotransferase
VSVAVVLSLLLTGNYRRSEPSLPSLRLMVGSALGALVVCWSNFWAAPSISAIPIAALLSITLAGTLLMTRGALIRLKTRFLPEERRLIPAVVVRAEDGDHHTIDPLSGYRAAGLMILDRRASEMTSQNLARLIRQCRAESVIVFGNLRALQFERLLEISMNAGCELLCSPPGFALPAVRPNVVWRGPHPLVRVGMPALRAPQMFAKRCMDLVLSSLVVVLLLPVALLIALVIKLDSPGPVFFRQARVGLGGKRLWMLKFRTMRDGADSEKASLAHLNATGDPRLFKIPDDPRVSRVGRFLRKWSLDELPQFINVLAGEMSIVGPRPFFEADLEEYDKHHFRRLGAKPGISGMWQVFGRSTVTDFEEVVRLDTEYIDSWSLWLDLKILLMTVPAVLARKGAY